ncbi:hypothetical protein [Streptomyces chattanoogensis]|nr:hypothetical protein [Streptomyces chattanoogensis]
MSDEATADPAKTNKGKAVYEFLWGSPGLFLFVAMGLFLTSKNTADEERAWLVYGLAWVPTVLMGLWSLVARKKPHMPTAALLPVAYAVVGVPALVFHGDVLPF